MARQFGDLVHVVRQGPISDDVRRIKFRTAKAAQAWVRRQGDARVLSPRDSGSSSRYNDNSPWYGGDRIDTFTNDGRWVESCTAGFGYTDPYYAPPQMLFAGHCGPSGPYWWNATAANQENRFMGITGWQTFDAGYTDAALITVGSGETVFPDIYVRDNTYWPTAGAASNSAGNQFCSDGSYTQEACTGQIDACGKTVQYDGGVTVHDLCVAHSVGGTTSLSQPGDSGGPIISGSR